MWCKESFLEKAEEIIGADKFDAKHFTPRYKPWEERLCLDPDGAFYQAIGAGKASVVTDHIQEFTPKGIRLKESGQELEADIIVTATGLELMFAGGMDLSVNGAPLVLNQKFGYKGFMLDRVPNLFLACGYTNASWTLKVDMTNDTACRLIQLTERRGKQYCQPETPQDEKLTAAPFLDLRSGYIQRNADKLPKQATDTPWKVYQNYLKDKLLIQYQPLDDGVMKFY